MGANRPKPWRALRRSRHNALAYAFGAGFFLHNGLANIGWWSLGYAAISALWCWHAWTIFEGEAATDA